MICLSKLQLHHLQGFQNYFTNGPTVENKGIEVELGYDILKNQNFNWSINLNWAKT